MSFKLICKQVNTTVILLLIAFLCFKFFSLKQFLPTNFGSASQDTFPESNIPYVPDTTQIRYDANEKLNLLTENTFASIYVDECIYYFVQDSNFLMRFEIRNTSNDTIGFELERFKCFYPNQWRFIMDTTIFVENEERIIYLKQIKSSLIKQFKSKNLWLLAPKKSLEYYVHWNNNSNQKIESKKPNEFLKINFDGQIEITNGKKVKALQFTPKDEEQRIVIFENPVKHKIISQETPNILK